jgi:hypothetical protein
MNGNSSAAPLAATTFSPGEIAVALPHLDIVLAALAGRGREEARDQRLGLARVVISDLPETAADFASRQGARRPGLSTDSDLDIVLTGLRRTFAGSWGGWTPTMGKNRDVLGGEGTPYIKIMTEDGAGAAPRPIPAVGNPYTDDRSSDAGTGGLGVRIGLLDTRVAPGLDLDDTLVLSEGDVLVAPGGPWPYRSGHATFLAGLIHQYAPKASIVVRPVLHGPDAKTTSWNAAVGLLDLVHPTDGSEPVDIVVMALGCFTADAEAPLVLQTAVSMVRDDAVLLAAGGNYADMTMDEIRATALSRRSPMWPAALDGVTAVGSHDRHGKRSRFSPAVPWVDLSAPGEQLRSTYFNGQVAMPDVSGRPVPATTFTGSAEWTGSSLSTAVAAGRLAVRREGDEPLTSTLQRVLADGDAPYLLKSSV